MTHLPARVKVRLFHELRSEAGTSELELEADTVGDALQSLIKEHGGLKDMLFDSDGNLRGQILFYVNNSALNSPDLARKLNDGDLLLLVPPAAGG